MKDKKKESGLLLQAKTKYCKAKIIYAKIFLWG